MAGTVIIVDDEVQLVKHLEYLLKREGYQAIGVHDAEGARKAVLSYFPDVVLIDLKLPDADGTELMKELLQVHPQAGYVIITAHGSIRSAVDATRLGARDYLTKPFDPDELLVAVGNAMRDRLREEEISVLRKAAGPSFRRKAVGRAMPSEMPDYPSSAMKETLIQAQLAAATDSIVLLQGESGTGKDYLARFIHDRSRRSSGPFFAINCAAVSPELAESELFGHEPGAFTGARGRKRGLLELAEGGTLLLNEIGELSKPMQAKLLTFLDTRSFTRVGGENQITVSARLVAATNKDLHKEVTEHQFRSDLFFRLNVFAIRIPPLRQRLEDIGILAQEILAQLTAEMGFLDCPDLDAATVLKLSSYDWPGNVRELRNVLERSLMLSGPGTLTLAAPGVSEKKGLWSYTVNFPDEGANIHDLTRDMKRSLVLEALRRTSGSKQGAARLLGISRHAFAHQMRSVGLED
ncbi:MAG: sigma-54-dependent Fis family transcriptional regulator [Desulfomonile tiedjei]|nr:sigma-54-dependent Fis family transcriptional regulator [Desulfomonile tiedjei]